ncbi:hypothetical protein [Arcobacter sp. FWKO B]|uniref:hypothetical protein n=1 Tax=Arcobacter sp. FWKO B TaxID=2593672 RepID=UPI0018A4C805|nr:hypothetical protein [Arcobacter sp. FWKO B]QOG13003.1 hypothetical protein FWKOB_10020 [Arcobacter sp. FWKO B]
MIAKILLLAFLSFNYILAFEPEAECTILEDENSIVCKFTTPAQNIDQTFTIMWINPLNEIDRQRDITIPAHNVSIYDFRYLDGRESGRWKFSVFKNDKKIAETAFSLDK